MQILRISFRVPGSNSLSKSLRTQKKNNIKHTERKRDSIGFSKVGFPVSEKKSRSIIGDAEEKSTPIGAWSANFPSLLGTITDRRRTNQPGNRRK